MAKTSKTVPQKEKASSSSRTTKAVEWYPGVVNDLSGWVRRLDSICPYAKRVWRDLAKTRLGEAVLMREPPPGEADTPRPTNEKKRKKKSLAGSPKPKKAKVQKPEVDLAALTREAAEGLCSEGEESNDCPLAPRGRRSDVASKSSELKVAGSEAAEVVPTRDGGIAEGSSDEVPEPTNNLSTSVAEGHLVDGPDKTNDEAPRREERALVEPVEVINVDEPLPGPSFSPRQIRDTQDMKIPVEGASLGENSTFQGCFVGVEEGPDIDASLIFEEAEKLRQQALKLSNQAFSKSQEELSCCEDEFGKLVSELDELKALYAQKEGELGDLRAHSERISRVRADFDEQLKQKDDLKRKELRVRDTKILGLKQHMDEVSSNKEILRESLTSAQCQLQGAREESRKYRDLHVELDAELDAAKSEADALMSSYRKDAASTNARARKVSEEAKLKLSRALEHARLRSRRQAFEDIYAGAIDLLVEIERIKVQEEETATQLSSDGGSANESTSGSEDDEDDGEVPEGEEAGDVPGAEDQG
ncbi:PREDICTED: cingulin-like [Nicotiana attenuata]|uniref:cingulin-like n=1 Tax=Nicotiana attenuata TaxID=49451 RepID=UPI0009056647|nr:PREDICTED: cingulin-like [Nicotiana attenuata]